jgi:hypothetical protein
VCYDFFCRDVLNTPLFKTTDIQVIIRDFISVGDKAHGNMHLVCIDNLDGISSKKIEEMSAKIDAAMERVINSYERFYETRLRRS